MIKYRKCKECGSKMAVKKSGKGTKFWACTSWRETGCNGSAEYYGLGAHAGLHLSIREIQNGYVITTSSPFAGPDEDPEENYVKSKDELPGVLTSLFEKEVKTLCDKIEESSSFTEEVDQEKHKIRVEKRGTTDVAELLKRMAKTTQAAKEIEAARNGD